MTSQNRFLIFFGIKSGGGRDMLFNQPTQKEYIQENQDILLNLRRD